MTKIIKLIGGREYLIEDEEFEVVKDFIRRGKLIELTNGDLINPSSISHAGELAKRRFWGGYPLEQDKENSGEYFIRDGERMYLEVHNYEEVEEKDDPRYLGVSKVKLLE